MSHGGLAPRAISGGVSASGAASDQAATNSASGTLRGITAASFGRSQIKTASIQLRTDKVGAVVSGIEQVAATQGGFVDSEQTSTDSHGVAQSSSITLRVPVDNFEAAVDAVSGLGTATQKRISTEDVTGRVADVSSRVTSARQAIAQLRLLFNKATKLGDIITLESELSGRQADLEALEAEQRALNDQTSLATIAVNVAHPAAAPPAKPAPDQHAGFLGGLRQGWDALAATFGAVAHGLGAVIPWGLTLLVIGSLVWLVVRRVPRHRPDTTG